jgi:hypothetical protein
MPLPSCSSIDSGKQAERHMLLCHVEMLALMALFYYAARVCQAPYGDGTRAVACRRHAHKQHTDSSSACRPPAHAARRPRPDRRRGSQRCPAAARCVTAEYDAREAAIHARPSQTLMIPS